MFTAAAYSIQMYSIVKTKSLKRCNSCLQSKFSQQTNLSMKISILGSISAENEDKSSMKITQNGYYVNVTKYARQYVFLKYLFVMKANLFKFSVVLEIHACSNPSPYAFIFRHWFNIKYSALCKQ